MKRNSFAAAKGIARSSWPEDTMLFCSTPEDQGGSCWIRLTPSEVLCQKHRKHCLGVKAAVALSWANTGTINQSCARTSGGEEQHSRQQPAALRPPKASPGLARGHCTQSSPCQFPNGRNSTAITATATHLHFFRWKTHPISSLHPMSQLPLWCLVPFP